MDTVTGNIIGDGILLIMGIGIACGLTYWLAYLPEKNAKVGAWMFKTSVQFMNDAHRLGRIPAPATKGTYAACQKFAMDYMAKNGMLACEVDERQRPATERVTDVLTKMEYTEPQINRILHEATVVHGDAILKNFDELLWFALKTAEKI